MISPKISWRKVRKLPTYHIMMILNLTLRHMLLFESRYLHRDSSVCYKLVMLTDIFEEVSTQQLRVRRRGRLSEPHYWATPKSSPTYLSPSMSGHLIWFENRTPWRIHVHRCQAQEESSAFDMALLTGHWTGKKTQQLPFPMDHVPSRSCPWC